MIYTDPLSDCDQQVCGNVTCPCNSLQKSFYSAYNNTSLNITSSSVTISCAPGNYSGIENLNLDFSSPISIHLVLVALFHYCSLFFLFLSFFFLTFTGHKMVQVILLYIYQTVLIFFHFLQLEFQI